LKRLKSPRFFEKVVAFLADRLGCKAHRNQLQKQLEQASGQSLVKIIDIVECALETQGKTSFESRLEDLGGANNLGFLVHRSEPQMKPLWVTKFAYADMVVREEYFLQWHQANIIESQAIAPALKGIGSLGDSNIEFMTVETLYPPGKIGLADAVALYAKMQAVGELFVSQHGGENPFPQMTGGSRIRDLLLSFVCQIGKPASRYYVQDFFEQRRQVNPQHRREIDAVEETVSQFLDTVGRPDDSMLGLIHGDFKAANMMRDAHGNLKLVDFQYYQIGVRVWDLAFFMSKQKRSFDDIFSELHSHRDFSDKERSLLLCCYVLAVMLHLAPSNFKYKYRHHLQPAADELQRGIFH
jgi:hypothetical protein